MIKFTKDEKIIIIFLLVSLFIGISVFGYKKSNPEKDYIKLSFDETQIEEYKKININTASLDRLTDLKGIGPVMAGRIIEYRKEHGNFENKEDIKNVKGIGEKTFEKIENRIIIE